MRTQTSLRGGAALLIVSTLAACGTTPRPTPPPDGSAVVQPWGAVPYEVSESLSDSLVDSLRANFEQARAAATEGQIPYRALTLSGGGSRGAYGAGVLTGWTERGDRPQFDVVTGISTGALMATHAFLGSDFDADLEIYKDLINEDVYEEHGFFKMLRSTAANDTTPLRETLSSVITEETLDLVAAEHRAGRRLFIGTTNLDANLFTIWDMGTIAESDRPDRYKRYIDVVMASASFPVAFPPVYLDVEGEAGPFTEMHADGGVRETVFFFDFIPELHRAAEAAGLSISDFKQELYLLENGPLLPGPRTYEPAEGTIWAVAGASISALMSKVTRGSVYRLWVLAMVDGADFHFSYIPSDYEFTTGSLSFDPEEQNALFDLGYRLGLDGSAWTTQLAPTSTEELIRLITDPVSRFDFQERPSFIRLAE